MMAEVIVANLGEKTIKDYVCVVRHVQAGNLGKRKPANFGCIGSCPYLANRLSAEDVGVVAVPEADVMHKRKQRLLLNLYIPNFLKCFPLGCCVNTLAFINMAAGRRPEAAHGAVCALDEKELSAFLHYNRDGLVL
jgi:hypothetical protein